MAITDNIGLTDNWFIGEDKDLVFTIYQAGSTQAQIDAGTALKQDITGWTLEWALKGEDRDTAALLTKTTTTGIALTTPSQGVATVSIADTDTTSLNPGRYRYALKRTNDGLEAVLAEGEAILKLASIR